METAQVRRLQAPDAFQRAIGRYAVRVPGVDEAVKCDFRLRARILLADGERSQVLGFQALHLGFGEGGGSQCVRQDFKDESQVFGKRFALEGNRVRTGAKR